jgi:hypothetical protein
VWRKSSYSDSPTSDCVEVAFEAEVRVRDSKNTSPLLQFGAHAWREFLQQAAFGGEGAEGQ